MKRMRRVFFCLILLGAFCVGTCNMVNATLTSEKTSGYLLYVVKEPSWINPHIYVWEDSNKELAPWPGMKLDKEENGYWVIALPEGNWNRVVYNNGDDSDRWIGTADLAISPIFNEIYSSGNVKQHDSNQYAISSSPSQGSNLSGQYDLHDEVQNGVILHCFNWKYKDIEESLEDIATAGFSSVLTSPAQPSKPGENGVSANVWYWLYQPLGFRVGTNAIGTKEELASLCAKASDYGIKIIVDVVANQLASGDEGGENVGYYKGIDSIYKEPDYWHSYGDIMYWNDRNQVTNGRVGVPDLNTENTFIQQQVKAYIGELKSIGVAGVRWDGAKYSALPSENSLFWPNVISADIYNCGDILGGPIDYGSKAEMEDKIVEYTRYLSVTDTIYSQNVYESFKSGTAPSNYGFWSGYGVDKDKLVYIGENFDTYSCRIEATAPPCDQNVADRSYVVLASRNGETAIYFSRPVAVEKKFYFCRCGRKG